MMIRKFEMIANNNAFTRLTISCNRITVKLKTSISEKEKLEVFNFVNTIMENSFLKAPPSTLRGVIEYENDKLIVVLYNDRKTFKIKFCDGE